MIRRKQHIIQLIRQKAGMKVFQNPPSTTGEKHLIGSQGRVLFHYLLIPRNQP